MALAADTPGGLGGQRPRPYQEACVREAVAGNTIVSLPTGAGKTLVAAMAIDALGGRALVAVPTRVLVGQQAEYCRQHCSTTPRVVELAGNDMECWTRDMWKRCVRDNQVLVGTPEVFRRALVDTGYISATSFRLVVLDECHNATGNSPMASIMRDAIWPLAGKPSCPRILGLTASFVNGRLKNVEQKRQQLETLLQSSLFCPEVPVDHAPAHAGGRRASMSAATIPSFVATAGGRFHKVLFRDDGLSASRALVENKLRSVLNRFECFGVPFKDVDKLVSRTCHVLEELGMSAFLFALREGVIPQLEAHAQELGKMVSRPAAYQQASRIKAALPNLSADLRRAAASLSEDGQLTSMPFVSAKAETLLDLICRLFSDHAPRDPDYRGIIFVTQISLTFPLAHLLNHHFRNDSFVNAGAVSGVGSMADSARSQEVDRFRRGDTSVLVCTNALEEGVDVSDCTFVIRFNKFDTTKSHIQGSGRARRRDAEVYYFSNDPEQEERGARHMTAVARDRTLALGESERLVRKNEATKEVPGVYPYRPAGGFEVNLFNCLQIVYEYCQRTMRQGFDPERLYTYNEEVVCIYPRQVRRYISQVMYPSPQGMQHVTLQDANAVWGSVALDDVLDHERTRNMDASDKEKRRMLYAAALDMHRKDFLMADNQPSAEALSSTVAACAAIPMSPGIKLRNTFAKDALVRDAPRAGPDPPPKPAPATPKLPPPFAATDPAPNFKGTLNEWALKCRPGKAANELLQYKSEPCECGFHSTVSVVFLGLSFSGVTRPTKKAAEQAAAEVALGHLDAR